MEPLNNLEMDLTCPVYFTPLTDAVSLPCAHKVGEVAARELYGSKEAGFKTAPCPICNASVSNYTVDHTMRSATHNFAALQKSILEKKEPVEIKVEQKKTIDLPIFTSFDEVKKYVTSLLPQEIESLDLSKIKNITDHDLKLLEFNLPNLKQLIVRSDKITSIPFKLLEKLECSGCINISELSLGYAKELICRACTGLKNIFAPLAEEIECNKCETLIGIQAPQAKKVICWECKALPVLFLPEALDVNCSSCYKLAELSLAKATKVDCSDCGLKKLSLPVATWIKCSSVTKIEKQEFPEAELVICTLCNFKNLLLPKLKWYDDFGSSKEMKITAPWTSERKRMSY